MLESLRECTPHGTLALHSNFAPLLDQGNLQSLQNLVVRRIDLAHKVSPDGVVQRIQIRRGGLPFRTLDVAGKMVIVQS